MDLKSAIRTIPDYPKPGIMFRDITTLLGDANGLKACVQKLAAPFTDRNVDAVAGIEAGRAVVLPDWLPAVEVAALRADAVAMHGAGHFTADALATYGVKVRERENVPRTFRLLAPERSLSF